MSPFRSIGQLIGEAYFNTNRTRQKTDSSSVAAVLGKLKHTEANDLALICGLLGVHSDQKSHMVTPRARIRRLVDVIGQLVRSSDPVTKVLIFEDVHWIDEPGRLLLSGLAQAITGTSTLLLLNTRPTEADAWLSQITHCIELNELSRSDTSLLVDNLVGPAAALTSVRVQIAARSAGNPFFAEELVRSLVDEGVMMGKPGAYSDGHLSSRGALPLTVQAVIGSRIDRLSKSHRDLLQVAAVIGKEFDFSVLQAVFNNRREQLSVKLDRLQTAGLVGLRGHSNDGHYEFRHPLIQEVAYTTQLRDRRSHLHAEVARALRELDPQCDGDMAGIIAVHLEEAGQFEEAAVFASQAARWLGQHSSSAAIDRWHKVRSLLSHAHCRSGNEALAIEANGQVAWLGWREGYTAKQAEPYLKEALSSATRAGHPMTSLLMLARGRIAQVSGGDADVFVSTLMEAASLPEAQAEPGRAATLQASLSHAYGWAGLLNHALSANDAALKDAHLVTDVDQQFLGYDVRNWALSLRGRILLRLGLLSPARACFDEIIAREGSIDPTVTFVGHFGYVELAQHTGDPGLAADHADYIDALARRHGNAYLTFYAAVSKALSAGVAGQLDEAIRNTISCLDLQRQSGAAVEFEPELLASLADFQKRAGMYRQAHLTAIEGATMARSRNTRLALCKAIIVQAEASLLVENTPFQRAQAGRALEQAERLLEKTGARLYRPLLESAQSLLG